MTGGRKKKKKKRPSAQPGSVRGRYLKERTEQKPLEREDKSQWHAIMAFKHAGTEKRRVEKRCSLHYGKSSGMPKPVAADPTLTICFIKCEKLRSLILKVEMASVS